MYNASVNLYQAIDLILNDIYTPASNTNLTNTPSTTTILLESSTGTDTTLPAATTTAAGVMTAADKVKTNSLITLSGVAANSTNLGTFPGTSIPDNLTIKQALTTVEEYLDYVDAAGALTSNSSAITLSGSPLTLSTGSAIDFVPAQVNLQDLGGALTLGQIDTTGVTTDAVMYFDGANWSFTTSPAVEHNGLASKQGGTTNEYYHLSSSLYNVLASSNANRIIGRYSAGSGAVQALTLPYSVTISGSGLQLTNDAATPGNSKYYGTDGSGVKGFFSLPTGSGTLSTATDSDDLDFTITGSDLTAILTTTGVAADIYGAADETLIVEVDDKGRVLDVVQSPISIVSTQISNFVEATQDVVGGLLVAGSGVSITYSDAGNTLTISSSATYTDEAAQDAVGGILVDSTDIDFTYTDATPSITASLLTTGVTAASYGSASSVPTFTVDSKGRLTAASNTTIAITATNVSNFDEAVDDRVSNLLTAGTDISLSYNDASGTLTINSTAGSGGSPAGTNYNLQYYNSGAFGADSNITVTPGSAPKLVVGTSTPAATIHAKGPNNTGSTALLVENSSGNNIHSTLTSGYFQFGDNESLPRIYQTGTVGGSVGYTRTGLTIQGAFGPSDTYDILGITHTSILDGTDGPYCILKLSGTHAPSADTGEYVGLKISQVINQTGANNGEAFGIQVAPTLTAIGYKYTGILVAVNDVDSFGFAQEGSSAINYFDGSLGIGTVSPSTALQVVGSTTSTHFIGGGSAPSVSVGSSSVVGTGGNASVSGTDTAFTVTLNVGSGSPTSGTAFTVTFNTAYASAPIATFSPNSTDTANDYATYKPYVTTTTTTLVFTVFGSLTASTTYKWNFINIGK